MNPGDILDSRYEIVSRLGAGGMGEVYQAVHTHLGAPRVIKIVHPNISGSDDAKDRFLREARTATKVHHPNVATLHDFSTLPGGAHYMVWEFIDGENLAQRLRSRGTLPPRQAIHIMLQALFGLDAIHRAGIVHRDISPENLMITADDTVKIIDMGVAKDDDAGAVSQTRTGIFVGKLRYAAPEQLGFIPDGEKIDGRADIYAMAMVLFEVLTGRPPYEAKSPHEYFMIHANPAPMKAIELPAEIPGRLELQEVLEKALARDRNERYATARDFAAALEMVELRLPTVRDGDTPTIVTNLGGGMGSGTAPGRTTSRDTWIRTARDTSPRPPLPSPPTVALPQHPVPEPTVARPMPLGGIPTQLTPLPGSAPAGGAPFPAQAPKQGSLLPLFIIGVLLLLVAGAVGLVMFWPSGDEKAEEQVVDTTTTGSQGTTTQQQQGQVAEASVTVTSLTNEPTATTTTGTTATTITAAPTTTQPQIVPTPVAPTQTSAPVVNPPREDRRPPRQEPPVVAEQTPPPAEDEAPRPGLSSAARYVDGGDEDENERALETLRRQLQGTTKMSLRGGAMREELYRAMRDQLPDMDFEGEADVIIRFEGTAERRGRAGLKRRAGTGTVMKGGRVIFRYELPGEDYRVGDNAAEAFARVIANAVE